MSFSFLSKWRLSHWLLSLEKWLSEAQIEFSSQQMDGKHIFSIGIYRVYWTTPEADCKNNALPLWDLTTTLPCSQSQPTYLLGKIWSFAEWFQNVTFSKIIHVAHESKIMTKTNETPNCSFDNHRKTLKITAFQICFNQWSYIVGLLRETTSNTTRKRRH